MLILYAGTLSMLRPDGFWVVDNANKFLLMEAIARAQTPDFFIPWPGQAIDPAFRYNPLPPPFTGIHDGKLYSVFSPCFAAVSLFFFNLFGFWGLYLLPLLSGVLLLAGVARIARMLTSSAAVEHSAVLMTGLCTPVWFYSVVFWEHIVAVSLCVWSVYFCLRFLKHNTCGNLVTGNVLLALSIYFRDDLYLLVVVVISALILSGRDRRVRTGALSVATIVAVLLPLWIFQWITIHAPFGHHLESHLRTAAGIADFIQARPGVFYNLFVASNPSPWLSALLVSPFIIAFFLKAIPDTRASAFVMPACGVLAIASSSVYFADIWTAESAIAYLFQASNSLFVAAPVIILGCLRFNGVKGAEPEQRWIRSIWIAIIAYSVLYGLAAPETGSKGIHWANRFLLVIYPFLALLGAVNLIAWFKKTGRKGLTCGIPLFLVILVSLALQLFSLDMLRKKTIFTSRLNQELAMIRQPVIVTDQWWAAHEMYSQFYNKTIFFVPSSDDLAELARVLSDQGYHDWVYATAIYNEYPARLMLEIDDGGLNFFGLRFFEYRTSAVQGG